MSGTERRYQRSVDEMILAATGKELERLQQIDLDAQKQGGTFYESFALSGRNFGHLLTQEKS